MSKRPATTLNAIASKQDDPDAIVEAGEMVDLRFPMGGRMSLRSAKLFHLLVKVAGVDLAEDKQHRFPLAALNESFHISVGELETLIDELHSTTIKLKLTDEHGRRFTKSGPFLSDVEREEETQAQAEIRFSFSSVLRQAIANSTHWAIISRRAVLAFESKYSLRLYTVLSLRAGLRKTHEDFSVEDLRQILGVPSEKLTAWKNLRLRALDPAIEEINHLAGFRASYVPQKQGRKVVGITLSWGQKGQDEVVEAMKELERPRVGRKVRRQGATERIIEQENWQREALAAQLSQAMGSISTPPD